MIYFILLLGIFLRLLNLDQSLWLDEAAQVIESARPLYSQLDISGDFWPPFYHLLLHFWMAAGKSEIWLRLLSVSIGVVTIYFFYKLVTGWISRKVALLVSVILVVSPFHVWYSQEVRPYALVTLGGVLTTYFLLNQKWFKYTLSAALFMYSTYLAPFFLVTQGVYVIWFKRKKLPEWVKCIGFAILTFLPWLPAFYRQFAIGRSLTSTLPGWSEAVSTPQIKALPLIFAKFSLGRITFDNKFLYGVIVVVMLLLVVYLGYQAYKAEKSKTLTILLLGGLPILLVFLSSFFLPVLAPQRVLFSLPFFYLILALGINSLPKLKLLPLSVILLVSLYSLYLYNTNPRFQRENWRAAVSFVEKYSTHEALALFAFPEPFAPWQWYSRNIVTGVGLASNFVITQDQLNQYTNQLMTRNQLYYFHYLTDLTDPYGLSLKYLENLGFTEVKKTDFSGVGFVSTYEKAFALR